MRTSLYDYCAERNELALLTQWHPVKNGPLTPRQVSYGSRQKIWWLCPKGHAWQAAVYTRVGVPTVPGNGRGRGKTIWRPSGRTCWINGIPPKTCL